MLPNNRTKGSGVLPNQLANSLNICESENDSKTSVNDYMQLGTLVSYDYAEVGSDMTDRYSKWTSNYGEGRGLVIH
jgi:hypothetical protein